MSSSPAAPWLLGWQGLLAADGHSRLRQRLPQLAGALLTLLLLLMPFMLLLVVARLLTPRPLLRRPLL